MAWSVELSEFDLSFEPRGPIKSQHLADFVNELTPSGRFEDEPWTLHVDGSSNAQGSGAGVILASPLGVTIEQETKSLKKGNCYIVSTSPPNVYKAYLNQFQKDFKLFLKSRSEELVYGGAMVLVFSGNTGTPRRTCWEIISLILNDMFLEGLIEEEKLDSFNIPVFEPTIEEVRHVIKEEGSFFVQRLEICNVPWDECINDDGGDFFLDGNIRAKVITKHARAVMEPLLSVSFGAQVINEVFIRFQKKIVQLMEVEKLESGAFVMSVTKIA
ncbi:salicylate/benzoate carboxyl methyltransferase [Cajanus cajan]|uniref:salicylate/benzoate carboxyl methyltransferase n=1 Tax=Cajanus cajan TaxID=3821 RepID=UPI00098DB0DB|nr:salicylate/benzoate carboxyl methyltransferase [Cajanus cajan]